MALEATTAVVRAMGAETRTLGAAAAGAAGAEAEATAAVGAAAWVPEGANCGLR